MSQNLHRNIKNLWRRKCVRRVIFRNVEVRVEGGCHCATCQESSYTKNEYSLSYRKFDAEYFFIQQFFRKKSCIFRENHKKLFWRRIWQFFRERRRLTPKINITFFITNDVSNILLFNNFFQKCVIFWENRFWSPNLF